MTLHHYTCGTVDLTHITFYGVQTCTYYHTLIELGGYSREGMLILFLLDNQCAGTQGHLHLAKLLRNALSIGVVGIKMCVDQIEAVSLLHKTRNHLWRALYLREHYSVGTLTSHSELLTLT